MQLPPAGGSLPADAELLLKPSAQKPEYRKADGALVTAGEKNHLRIPTTSTVWTGPLTVPETVTKHYVAAASVNSQAPPAPRCTTTLSRSYIVKGNPSVYCAELSADRLLPMREVDHFTSVCTVPGPVYDLQPNVDPRSAATRRRRRRKMRGCGDCAFCEDCAIPFMDTVVGCLSAILLSQGGDAAGSLLHGDAGSYYPAGYYDMMPGTPGPTVDTFCMDCGDIFRSEKVDGRLFADMLAKRDLSSYTATKRRTEDEESGKIPLPTFPYAPPHPTESSKGRKPDGNETLFEWKARESESRQGHEFAYPKDESGRVALPAFKLEEKDKGLRGIHKRA